MNLPDFEAWAIFVKVIQTGSFSRAALELGLSKATVSKAVTRLEARLGSRLLQRTSRRIAPTEIGRQSLARAQRMLAEAEAADGEASEQAALPRGTVRITASVFFGIEHIAPLLPGLFEDYPNIAIDLHLSDEVVDLVGAGFDLAVRIATLADSTLRAKRLCAVRTVVVGAPAYFAAHGTPVHPHDLTGHRCLIYARGNDPGRWHFKNAAGEAVVITPRGPLRGNSGESFLPLLRAGCGVTVLPEFMVWRDLAAGRLRCVLSDWTLASLGLNLVMPPGTLRPARVQVVIDALTRHLSDAAWASLSDQGIHPIDKDSFPATDVGACLARAPRPSPARPWSGRRDGAGGAASAGRAAWDCAIAGHGESRPSAPKLAVSVR